VELIAQDNGLLHTPSGSEFLYHF